MSVELSRSLQKTEENLKKRIVDCDELETAIDKLRAELARTEQAKKELQHQVWYLRRFSIDIEICDWYLKLNYQSLRICEVYAEMITPSISTDVGIVYQLMYYYYCPCHRPSWSTYVVVDIARGCGCHIVVCNTMPNLFVLLSKQPDKLLTWEIKYVTIDAATCTPLLCIFHCSA